MIFAILTLMSAFGIIVKMEQHVRIRKMLINAIALLDTKVIKETRISTKSRGIEIIYPDYSGHQPPQDAGFEVRVGHSVSPFLF